MLLSEEEEKEEEEREAEEKVEMPSLRTLRYFSYSKDPHEKTAPREEKGSRQGHTASNWMRKD